MPGAMHGGSANPFAPWRPPARGRWASLKTYEAHSHFVTTIAFNQKSPVVATGSVDQSAKIWECR